MSTRIYLIRHAATAANESHPAILQGCNVDRPLSETGKRQAGAMAEFLAATPLQAIYSSPLSRAVATAEAIAATHAGLPVNTVDDLREANVGVWEKMTWEQVMQEYPYEHKAFVDGQPEVAYLGGESYLDVLHRVRPVINSLGDRHDGETIAVVAHHVVNRMYVADLLSVPLNLARWVRQENTGINVINYDGPKTQLLTLNSHFHLATI